ncbi:MAG TPA: multiheme c-type cytochrome, partial [Isosphaeraceae bacterium]|nr:multiheme c-type cytochrome [Isosphaeraceae bacterium]
MSPKAVHRPIVWVATLCVAIAIVGLGERGRGEQPARSPLTEPSKSSRTPAYVSATRCNPCHDHPKELTSQLVDLNEYPIWAQQDPHSKAHARLNDERSKRMARLLWQSETAERKECLSCHAPGYAFQKPGDPSSAITEGVSCVACHGSFQEWVGAHWLDKNWTKLPPEIKESAYGMTDLRDPAKQAKLCLSCHVGDAREGKVVTHAMYAAGHPPLPSIEVTTFSQSQPPHWRRPEQVPLLRDQP